MTIWTKGFWLATLERVVRTAAGALLAVTSADGFDLLNTDWKGVLATVGLASLVSLLLAIVSNASTRTGPAFTDSERVNPPEPQPTDEYIPERALNDDA